MGWVRRPDQTGFNCPPNDRGGLRSIPWIDPEALANTLNRLELGEPQASEAKLRYCKIVADEQALDGVLVEVFLASHAVPPRELWLDLDATDDPLHGAQEGRFFHGYYRQYCYLPLYIFCAEHLLCARLWPSNIDASAGSVEAKGPAA